MKEKMIDEFSIIHTPKSYMKKRRKIFFFFVDIKKGGRVRVTRSSNHDVAEEFLRRSFYFYIYI